jgi:hypothetical protein
MRVRARLAAVCFVALSAAAQQQPKFFIERITVRNLQHASPEVIVAESRLTEQHAYTEDELREASDRIRRLPFVLDASFALQKGSERERYVLEISVSETKPFFYLSDGVLFKSEKTRVLIDKTNNAVVGARFFAGRRGAFHVGVLVRDPQRPYINSYSVLQAGYTHYDVLGTRAFVTVGVNRVVGFNAGKRFLPEAVVGIPLSKRQTLTVTYTASDFGTTIRETERLFEARLSRNTTDLPFFPTRGTVLSFAPIVAWRDSFYAGDSRTPPLLLHMRTSGVEIEAKRYWSLSETSSLAAEGVAGTEVIHERRNGVLHGFTAGYGRALIRFSHAIDRDARDSQTRLELTARAISGSSQRPRVGNEGARELSVSWARRNAWGALRLGLGYAW